MAENMAVSGSQVPDSFPNWERHPLFTTYDYRSPGEEYGVNQILFWPNLNQMPHPFSPSWGPFPWKHMMEEDGMGTKQVFAIPGHSTWMYLRVKNYL